MRLSAAHVRHCLGFAHVGLREALNLQIEPPQNQEFIHLHLRRCILRLRGRFIRPALQLRLVRTYVSLLGNSALETMFELQQNIRQNVSNCVAKKDSIQHTIHTVKKQLDSPCRSDSRHEISPCPPWPFCLHSCWNSPVHRYYRLQQRQKMYRRRRGHHQHQVHLLQALRKAKRHRAHRAWQLQHREA